MAYEFTGDLRAPSQALAEAADLSRQAGNLHLAPMALSRLANLQAVQGQLRRASETHQSAMIGNSTPRPTLLLREQPREKEHLP